MPTTRYAQYDTTTGEILDIITRSKVGWNGDYVNPAGTALAPITIPNVDHDTHMVYVNPGDDYIIDRPLVSMGSDQIIEGDGSTQILFTSLPTGTKVYKDFVLLGTYSGDFTWNPTSPGDNGYFRFDLEPPFPDQPERYLIQVISP